MARKKAEKPKKKEDTRVEKHVRVTLELTASFVRKLVAKVALSRIDTWLKAENDPPILDPSGILTLLVYAEVRGAFEEQIWLGTPMEWRDELGLVHNERRVYEVTSKRHGRAWNEVSRKLITGPEKVED